MSRKASKPATATSRDVAARAGVSPMTVSRALRKPELVSDATRERVEIAARELDYVPDLVAGALSSQKSGHVAVLVPSLRHTGFLRTVEGLSSGLRAHGFALIIGDSFYSPDEEFELLRSILGRKPEAVVLIAGMTSDASKRLLVNAGIPVVQTWSWPSDPIDAVIGFSQRDAGYAMTASLIERGYRDIGFLAGPADTDPYGELRRRGYLAALADHGLPEDRLISASNRPMEIDDGAAGVVAFRERWPKGDALFCATDVIALGALNECRRRGWDVPGDIAIVGHGNFDFSASLVPSLSTVRVPGRRIGEAAAALIAARIDGDVGEDTRQDLGFELLHRESTGLKAASVVGSSPAAS